MLLDESMEIIKKIAKFKTKESIFKFRSGFSFNSVSFISTRVPSKVPRRWYKFA
jgi:hypothetical protein